MLVQDIMTTGVKSAHADSRVGEVALVMCFNKISGMPVVDADNTLIGIISEKDILHAMYPDVTESLRQDVHMDMESLEKEYRDIVNLHVKDVMKSKVITVGPEFPILKAVNIMCAYKIRRVPVAVNNRLVGIISIGDVHKAMFQQNMTQVVQPPMAAMG